MPEWMSRPKPHATIKETLSTIINQFFNKKKGENEQSFNKLLDMADSFSHDHEGFLKFITLGKAVDVYRPDMENVTLMTIHASKGLEFKCVFIIGCEKGILPYSLFEERVSDIDEEKRLLYVGMTRAKKFLYLLHAEKRFIFGKEYRLERSPFLSSIEKELIEHTTSKIKKKEKNGETQLKLFDFKKK